MSCIMITNIDLFAYSSAAEGYIGLFMYPSSVGFTLASAESQ